MAEETGEELFVFNGVDAARGGYLLPPMTTDRVVALANGEQPDLEARDEAVALHEAKKLDHFAPKEEVDPKDLAQAGWGVVFAHDEDPAIREALQPLLELRKEQASRLDPRRYRELTGTAGYRPGEKKQRFLVRQGAPNSGPVDPDRMPYYLLVVGDPEKIPFEFAAQLDLQYAVGRLHFDTVDEYAAYARSVVAVERGEVRLPRRLGLFGVKNPDDQATILSEEGLIRGLEKYVRKQLPAWSLDVRTADAAKKADLARVLGGPDTPAVLFTASHGAGFPNGDPRQLRHQGALVCQDWGGPRNWPGPLPEDMYFSADDLGDAARLAGLIAFHFACYGGGTPRLDAFFHRAGEPKPIAPRSFVAALPRRMLGHPRGGALAAVAHVERAWGCSFYASRSGHQIAVFESFIKRLLDGHPVGSALEPFGARYGELSSDLALMLEELQFHNKTVQPSDVASMWTANNDARNYAILGDPAVRVPAFADAAAGPRPTIELRAAAAAPKDSPVAAPASSDSQPAPVAQPEAKPAEAKPVSFDPKDIPDAPVAFGVFEDSPLKAIKVKLAAGMQGLADKLSKRLHAAVEDTTALEVATYVAPDLAGVAYDHQTQRFTGAALAAFTRVSFAGDTQQVLPGGSGEFDAKLWKAHQDAVAAAREHRSAMVKSGLEAIASLFTAIKDL